MEGKTYQTCLGSALDALEILCRYEFPSDRVGSYMRMMELEFRLMKMFLRGLSYLEDLEYDLHCHLQFAMNTMMPMVGHLVKELQANCRCARDPIQQMKMEQIIYDLVVVIQPFKQQIIDLCIRLLGGTFKCTSTPSNHKKILEYGRDIASFIDLILRNLEALQRSDVMAPVMKQQIALIQRGVEEFGMFVDPPSRLFDLIPCTWDWFIRVSCLLYLYWIYGYNESLSSTMETMRSDLMHKTMPCKTSGVISSYLQPTMIPQLLSCHLDCFLGDLVLLTKGDIRIFQEGLLFMMSFIMDPPDSYSEDREMTWAQVYAVVDEFPSLLYSIRSDEMNEEIYKANYSDFLMKVDRVKTKVRELFVIIPYSSQFTSPKTNATGFFEVLIENLKRMLEREMNWIPSLKHSYELLLNELLSLRPLFQTIVELLLDVEHKELKDLWGETIDVFYNVDYFTKVCCAGNSTTWYDIIVLPSVIEHIVFIKIQIKKLVGLDKMCINKKLCDQYQMKMKGVDALQPRGMTYENERVSVGFIKDERLLTNELRRGQKCLTIVSISGSGGQGKTTLAKRIYNDPNVQCHFQKKVWCYVSKDLSVKELLDGVLSCDTQGGGANELGIHDLAESVRKSLKGRRYLIVMDDIWDIDSWGHLESSFPDDKNGSRILFTTRNHNLASQVKFNSISHSLPLFSDEESWELMKRRVFNSNNCDGEFVGMGKKIASYCKGLPLAVALIAGVLRRTKHNLHSWKMVGDNLKAHLAQEGCGNVLEHSYKYLPDHLKSCFLYFTTFKRGELVRAKALKLLWVYEGLAIQDGGTKFSEDDLATKYLKDLVSHGLVDVMEWNSMGEIKRCNVHDLLYDLCMEKAKEDNFLHWADESIGNEYKYDIHSRGKLLKYNHHRICIGERDHFITSSPIVSQRGLPTSSLHSFLWSYNCTFVSSESSLWYLASFKILTILKLKCRLNEIPEVILSNISLRYLELKSSGAIKVIPHAIANLWRLGALIIGSCAFDRTLLPLSMWDMKSLRHVNVDRGYVDLEGFDQKYSSKSNVETLGKLYLDEDDHTIAEILRRFPNLRKLKCQTEKRSRHVMELLSMVGSLLTQLESLHFSHFRGVDRGSYDENSKSILWDFAKINNLTKLTLHDTPIPWSDLSHIGKKLPNLLVLKLLLKSCKGSSWKLEDDDFSNLTYLALYSTSIVEFDISSCDYPLPCLEHLVLSSCRKLVEIPLVFGEISTLKTIKVIRGSKELKASAMRVLEEQREFGNNSFRVIV